VWLIAVKALKIIDSVMADNIGLLSVLLCTILFQVSLAVGNLNVQTFSNGSFSISVGGKQWFRSGSVGVRDLGRWWSQEDGSLELTGSGQSEGVNNVGPFTSYYYEWQAKGASSPALTTMVSVYEQVPAVLFVLVFNDKATNTNTSSNVNSTLSTFPSFVIEEGPVERGYVTWSGNSELWVHKSVGV
jgi:hypothetical protein